jgi:alanyl-tRNA synthetase
MDLTRDGGSAGRLVNKDDPRCIEIWNLVFIQYNAEVDGTYKPLPARHVDTGMGFERVCSIIQGTQNFTDYGKLPSNYNTDVFTPIFDKLTEMSGKKYTATMPRQGGAAKVTEQERVDVAFRVLADHIRTLSFAIADGIKPSNTDRGYVLRRILRRGLRYARDLGLSLPWPHGSLMATLSEVVIEKFGESFPELKKNRKRIQETLAEEEQSFADTLERGVQLFEEHLERLRKQNAGAFPAEAAFKLYDTYGFPVDLTEVMARENDLTLDTDAVERLLERQREMSRGAQKKDVVLAEGDQQDLPATEFVGYDALEARTRLLQVLERDSEFYAVVEKTPFYAEMGGQVGDRGELRVDGQTVEVVDCLKQRDVSLHKLAEPLPEGVNLPADAVLRVDVERRKNVASHHTATHLLHWALHENVGEDALQQGSLVAENRLRFDFTSSALNADQLAAIEEQVNRAIVADQPVCAVEQAYSEVSKRADIKQLFGEKYGDTVRVVQIGGETDQLNGYSMELCGGTHVRRTGELGIFRILSEGAISAGVRRIEAVTGLPGIHQVFEQLREERQRAEELQQKLADANKRFEKEKAAAAAKEAAGVMKDLVDQMDAAADLPRIEHDFGEGDPGILQAAINHLKSLKMKGAATLTVTGKGKIHYAVYVSPDYQKTHPANELLQEVAAKYNGKGGGNKEIARGAASA